MGDSSRTADDLSFLLGKTLEQVCIGKYQTLLNFFDRGTIEIACGVEIIAHGQSKKLGDEYRVDIGIELVAFLGKVICRSEKLDGAIMLVFDDEASVRLLLRGGGYESVNVSGGPKGNLTFY